MSDASSSADQSSSYGASSGGASTTSESVQANSSGAENGQGAGVGSGESYPVVSVVDGDTIKVRINGSKETIRLIGVDTPETKKPNTPIQCFGKEATSHMQSLVQSKSVQLVSDPSQDERDKYGRLLRYVYVGGSTTSGSSINVALAQIAGGFGREYTYARPYQWRSQFVDAQSAARFAGRGLWGTGCETDWESRTESPIGAASNSRSASTSQAVVPARPGSVGGQGATSGANTSGACTIKGNINFHGEKIAHLPGSPTYAKTVISPGKGERMFCSVADALAAGWRMAAD